MRSVEVKWMLLEECEKNNLWFNTIGQYKESFKKDENPNKEEEKMINNVVLVGRMTRDPELRRTNSGAAVTSFTIALNRNYNSADGSKADYIPCVCWGKLAENVDSFCSKGSLVGVEGRLRSRSYENSQGQKVYVIEVVCEKVRFIGRKSSEESHESSGDDMVGDNDFPLDMNDFGISEEDIQF